MMIIMYGIYDGDHVYCQETYGDQIVRVSREQVTENRRTIVEAAGRLFRERGFEAVTVAEVMQEAGLTHGGFYGYFSSKDELIGEALAAALTEIRPGLLDNLSTYASEYLSRSHRDDRACGCPTAALAAESIRMGPANESLAVACGAVKLPGRFASEFFGAVNRLNAVGRRKR